MNQDDQELTQEERERVIELLLGQDKVIALLYDKQETKPQFNGDVPSEYQQWQQQQQEQQFQQMQMDQQQDGDQHQRFYQNGHEMAGAEDGQNFEYEDYDNEYISQEQLNQQ